MIAFLKEMKQQYQSILENLREKGQPRQKVASKSERQFSNKLRGQHSKNLGEAGEFHHSSMQAEVKYISPHRRNGSTLENIVKEKLNAARAIAS